MRGGREERGEGERIGRKRGLVRKNIMGGWVEGSEVSILQKGNVC